MYKKQKFTCLYIIIVDKNAIFIAHVTYNFIHLQSQNAAFKDKETVIIIGDILDDSSIHEVPRHLSYRQR